MKIKRIVIIAILLSMSFNYICYSNADPYGLDDDLFYEYPKRISDTEQVYSPWFTNVFTIDQMVSQYSEGNTSESAQVIFATAFSDVNPDHVSFGMDTNGAAISKDGGKNWEYISTNLGVHGCQSTIWHPKDENTVYVVANSCSESLRRSAILQASDYAGLLKSTDCGKTWKMVLQKNINGGTRSNRQLAFDENGSMYVITNLGVYKSTDGEMTWTQLNERQWFSVNDLYVSDDGKTIITATTQGIEASFDGGVTWEKRNSNFLYPNATGIDVDPRNPAHWVASFNTPYYMFVESFDYGKTWYGFENVDCSQVGAIMFGGIRDDGNVYLYISRFSGSGAYKYSTDGGKTWCFPSFDITGSAGRIIGTTTEGIAISKKHPHIVYLAAQDRILKSTDGGKFFRYASSGHGGRKTVKSSPVVTLADGRLVFLATDGGLLITTTPYNPDEKFPYITNFKKIFGNYVAVNPRNPNDLLLGGNSQGKKILYRSDNCGKTWRMLDGTLSTSSYAIVSFHKSDPNIIYTNNGTSYDKGVTWTKNAHNISAVSNVNNDIVYSSESNNKTTKFFVSKDCGKSWDTCFKEDGMWALFPDKFDENILWILGGTNFDNNMLALLNIPQNRHYLKRLNIKTGEIDDLFDFRTLIPENRIIDVFVFAQDPRNEKHLIVNGLADEMLNGYGIIESYDGGKSWEVIPGMFGYRSVENIQFEERTGDVFVNGYMGMIVYKPEVYLNYKQSKK